MADASQTFGWLSDAAQPLVAPHLEYQRKNRWILEFRQLPAGMDSVINAGKTLRINCHKAARPDINFEETKVDRINGTVNLAGKPKFADLSVSFYDSIGYANIAFDDTGLANEQTAVSDVLESWRELIYQPNAGDAFGAVNNYKGLAFLHMLSPVDLNPQNNGLGPTSFVAGDAGSAIMQSWVYQGIFPDKLTYGEVDYSGSEVLEVGVTFKYDRGYRVAAQSALVV